MPVATLMTGYTVKAIQCTIARGDWQKGKAWRRAPDGRIFIDVAGFDGGLRTDKAQSKSTRLQTTLCPEAHAEEPITDWRRSLAVPAGAKNRDRE
jgi:hypothetical protein